jgi:hypothetical protein
MRHVRQLSRARLPQRGQYDYTPPVAVWKSDSFQQDWAFGWGAFSSVLDGLILITQTFGPKVLD